MRTILIGGSLALVAALIWFGATAPRNTEGDPAKDMGKEPVTSASESGQKGDAGKAGEPAAGGKPAPARPANWAAETPSPKGGVGSGELTYPSKAIEGGLSRLDGVVRINTISKSGYTQGANSVLALSVQSGKVRAYLQYFPDDGSFFQHQDGYVFAEAAPGADAKVEGLLAWGGGSGESETYEVVFESLGGEATGIRYKITPRK